MKLSVGQVYHGAHASLRYTVLTHKSFHHKRARFSSSKEIPSSDKTLHDIWNYWNDVKIQRKFFDELNKQLNLKNLEDWYHVSINDVIAQGGRKLLKQYNNSLMRALPATYPEYNWKTYKFSILPPGFWKDMKNQRQYFTDLAVSLGLKSWEDWYKVKLPELVPPATSIITEYYGGSLVKALMRIFPEHDWKLTHWESMPKGVLHDINNQRAVLTEIAKEMNMKSWEDWYKVQQPDIQGKPGASGILSHHRNSLVKALTELFPELDWKIYKFERVPEGHWNDRKNQREFLDEFFKTLNLKSWEDWYGVTVEQVQTHGGSGLLANYNNSLKKVLLAVYPEHDWQMHRFFRVSRGYWKEKDNAVEVLEYAAKKLGLKKLEDWYAVPLKAASALGLRTLIEQNGGLMQTLTKYYPDFPWDREKPQRPQNSRKVQQILYRYVEELFPKRELFSDYIHPHLRYTDSDKHIEFDVFVPSLMLAFEYQGEQHYHFHYLYGSPMMQKERDEDKRSICTKNGITLIEIPYWWDQTKNSLLATIFEARPDLSKDKPDGIPIPKSPPATAMKVTKTGVSEVRISPPPVQISEPGKWNESVDPTGWLMAVRVSGIRVFWNGETQLFFGNGTTIHAPLSFTENLPKDIPLEGELTCDSLTFDELYSVVSRKFKKLIFSSDSTTESWSNIRFRAVDLPTHTHLRLEERLKVMADKIIPSSIVSVATTTICKGLEHLQSELSKSSSGILLRKPETLYYQDDSKLLASEHDESEALVLEHKEDAIGGRTLALRTVDGNEFEIPFSKNSPLPPLGSVISYKYQGSDFESGKPIQPQHLTNRPDVEWEEILQKKHQIPYYLTTFTKGQPPKCR